MSIALAFIPLSAPAKLSASAIVAELNRQWPDLPTPTSDPASDERLIFEMGETSAIVAMLPAPIPWSDLEGPCQTSWLWDEAEAALRPHQAHIIVTVMGEEDPVERSRLLTQFCAAVLATCPEALGVFWGSAALLVPAKVFLDVAREVMPEGPPLFIWVDVRVGLGDDGSLCAYTAGMEALGHMEFETENAPEQPGELRDRLFALASYLVENGPVIKDGDTVGQDASEQIRVVYADSVFGTEGKVMRLEYGGVKRPRKR
ncbi:MAG TPA: DUF4261 domain-containing protein [Gemmatales bacterium]|nr:DUF4261 domain-containing protein [Gemmatales bacterium]HMP61378.1 DUF4261 domain-containing protein [Gemmatales bacterium]